MLPGRGERVAILPSCFTVGADGTAIFIRYRRTTAAKCAAGRIMMCRNARTAADFFGLPPNQVVELGTRVTL